MAVRLGECLSSLEQQTLRSFEVIVCDGGDDAGTLDVISMYSSLTITHLKQADTGVYDAMNKGLERARGNWLLFLGADDRLASPDALADWLRHSTDSASVVLGRVFNLEPRAALVPKWHLPKWGKLLLLKNTVHHQGALYRREALGDYRYPLDLKVFGDYHLNLTLYLSGHSAVVTAVHVASCHPGGLSKRFRRELYREEWRMKQGILPAGSRWWQPFWLMLKYLRKNLVFTR